jgi:hypothetical protein
MLWTLAAAEWGYFIECLLAPSQKRFYWYNTRSELYFFDGQGVDKRLRTSYGHRIMKTRLFRRLRAIEVSSRQKQRLAVNSVAH